MSGRAEPALARVGRHRDGRADGGRHTGVGAPGLPTCPKLSMKNTREERTMHRHINIMRTVVAGSLLALAASGCGTATGAAVGGGAGAAVGAGTGYGAGKGALIGAGVGAAAGAIYDITKHNN